MGFKVTVNSVGTSRVSINNQQRQNIRTVGIIPDITLANELAGLGDVDVTNKDNNEVLVYDEASEKFVLKELPVVNGGTF